MKKAVKILIFFFFNWLIIQLKKVFIGNEKNCQNINFFFLFL